jgi:hypothetical protein
MTLTADTPFEPADDGYHVQSADPLNLETNWWSINVPERRIGIWLHSAYYPFDGRLRWRVFAWDDRAADPARLAYYRKVETEVVAPAPDMRDITYPEGGYALRMRAPLMDYALSYEDAAAGFGLDVRFTAAHPPFRFTPGEAPMVHNPHLDQLGRYEGELVLGGERIPIDCWSVRDRTWGPREGAHEKSSKYEGRPARVVHPGGPRWREIERERGRGRVEYIFGHADGLTGFLAFARPQDGDALGRSPLNSGWLLKDGRFARLDKSASWMRNWRDPVTGWTAHQEVLLVDHEGREMRAEGVAISRMCEFGLGANSLMKWWFDGQVGWGEDQDDWRGDHFARMLQALRGA